MFQFAPSQLHDHPEAGKNGACCGGDESRIVEPGVAGGQDGAAGRRVANHIELVGLWRGRCRDVLQVGEHVERPIVEEPFAVDAKVDLVEGAVAFCVQRGVVRNGGVERLPVLNQQALVQGVRRVGANRR